MAHLDGVTLFYGALIISAAGATALWSATQVLLGRSAWQAKHGTREFSSTTALQLSRHAQRALYATGLAAVLFAVPGLLNSVHLLTVIAG